MGFAVIQLDIYKEHVLTSVQADLVFAGYALTNIENRGVDYLVDNKKDPVFIVSFKAVEKGTKMERIVGEAPKTKHVFGFEFPYFVVTSNSETEEVCMHKELFAKLGVYVKRLKIHTVG